MSRADVLRSEIERLLKGENESLLCPYDGRPCPHGGSCEVSRFGFGLPEKVD